MVKEIILADPGIIFRPHELSRCHIDYEKLKAQAAQQRRDSVSFALGHDVKATLKRDEAEAIIKADQEQKRKAKAKADAEAAGLDYPDDSDSEPATPLPTHTLHATDATGIMIINNDS